MITFVNEGFVKLSLNSEVMLIGNKTQIKVDRTVSTKPSKIWKTLIILQKYLVRKESLSKTPLLVINTAKYNCIWFRMQEVKRNGKYQTINNIKKQSYRKKYY